MSYRVNDPDRASNLANRILNGIGHRGSSFTDLDAFTHDEPSHRFLVQEFKWANEEFPLAQRRALMDLALEQRFTVWYVMFQRSMNQIVDPDRREIAWADMRLPDSIDVISPNEYRERYASWWAKRYRLEHYARVEADILIRKTTLVLYTTHPRPEIP